MDFDQGFFNLARVDGTDQLRFYQTVFDEQKGRQRAHEKAGGGQGVLGVIPAVVANIQALEAIKLLIGYDPSLAGKLFRFNGNDMKFQIDELQKNENCRACSLRFRGF